MNEIDLKYVIYGFELEYAFHDFNYMCFKCSIFCLVKFMLHCTGLIILIIMSNTTTDQYEVSKYFTKMFTIVFQKPQNPAGNIQLLINILLIRTTDIAFKEFSFPQIYHIMV